MGFIRVIWDITIYLVGVYSKELGRVLALDFHSVLIPFVLRYEYLTTRSHIFPTNSS